MILKVGLQGDEETFANGNFTIPFLSLVPLSKENKMNNA